MLIDSAIQIPLVFAAEKEHLVRVPAATHWSTVLARLGCQLWPERLNPPQHSTLGYVDAALGQQLHHARGREWVAQIPAHAHRDHVGWPAMTRESRGGPDREVPPAVCAGEALTSVAVVAITCDDALLAVRAGRHAWQTLQHLTTSQTPWQRQTAPRKQPHRRSLARAAARVGRRAHWTKGGERHPMASGPIRI